VDEGLKKRLVGATVLISLIVIFVPMLLEQEPVIETGIYRTNVPPVPDQEFPSRVLPLQREEVAAPPVSEITAEEKPEGRIDRGEEPAVTEQAPDDKPATEPVKPREGLSAWVIQVGSFSDRGNAEKLVGQLREQKFSAFMEQVDIKGKTLFRVHVGPEIDRQLAEEMLARVNRAIEPLKLKGSLKSYQ
jgi:DedD protein